MGFPKKKKKFGLTDLKKILYILTILFFMLIFEFFGHVWKQCSVAMIFLVCPGCFWTGQALGVCTDKLGSVICITDKIIFFRCDNLRLVLWWL